MSIRLLSEVKKEYLANSSDNLAVIKEPGSRIYVEDKGEWLIIGSDSKPYSMTGKFIKNFYAYRGTTSVSNQEIVDFSKFDPSKSYAVYKMVFLPEANCNIILNNSSYPIRIEDAFELDKDDMDITSMKIVESGIGFYIQYYIIAYSNV